MTRLVIGETSTGRNLFDVPFTKLSWGQVLNDAGSIGCTIPMYDRRARKIGLRAAATPLKSSLAIEENGTFMNAGPIWKHTYDEDAGLMTLSASGIKSYADHRTVNSVGVLSVGLLNAKGAPNPASTYTWANLSNTTMIKRIISMIRTWPNAAFPIVLPDDEAQSGNTLTIVGADLKSAGDAIDDIIGLDDGPDCMFDVQYVDTDKDSFTWQLRAGTVAKPQLSGPVAHRWDASVMRRSIRKINVAVDATEQASVIWTTGGQTGKSAIYDVRQSESAIAGGFPTTEYVDSSHTDVTKQATLARYGKETARTHSAPTEYWTFEVRADRKPYVGSYFVGDYCDIIVGDNDPYLNAGTYRRRILTISGDESAKWIQITTGVVTSG